MISLRTKYENRRERNKPTLHLGAKYENRREGRQDQPPIGNASAEPFVWYLLAN